MSTAGVTRLAGARSMVTGGAGFFGSHVVDALRAAGAPEPVVPRSRDCDLTSRWEAAQLLELTRPDLVLHLAAQVGGIGANMRQPGTFFWANMAMGLNVLDAARRADVAKVVMVGTCCSYPQRAATPLREFTLWEGYPEETNGAYGVAKRALITMAQAYRQQFGCHAITVIPANLYGPRDHFGLEDSHVIPAMIRKFEDARCAGADSVTLWGDGSPTREFLYVEDAARGVLLAAAHYDEPAPVNLGTGQEIAIADLARLVATLVGFGGQVCWDERRPNGQPRRRLDVTRAAEAFGFRSTVSIDEGLRRTIAWYRANKEQACC